LLHVLTYFFNLTLTEGSLPTQWKLTDCFFHIQKYVLGPLLFVIYIDGMIKHCNFNGSVNGIFLYADDSKLFNNPIDLQTNLNKLSSSWLELYQLALAPNKCEHMAINRKCTKVANQYFLNSIAISNVSMVRDLGIFVSCDLTWRNHFSYIVSKASVFSYCILHRFSSKNV